jgi:hypothetical protein
MALVGYGSGIHTSMSISDPGESDTGISSIPEGKSWNISAGKVAGYPTRNLPLNGSFGVEAIT